MGRFVTIRMVVIAVVVVVILVAGVVIEVPSMHCCYFGGVCNLSLNEGKI